MNASSLTGYFPHRKESTVWQPSSQSERKNKQDEYSGGPRTAGAGRIQKNAEHSIRLSYGFISKAKDHQSIQYPESDDDPGIFLFFLYSSVYFYTFN